MKFKVFWHPVARKILADLWLKSDSRVRKLLNQASDQIDRALSRDPLSEGESRTAGRRIAFAPPLGAIFRVDQTTSTVYVLRIWLIRPRKR
jgi:mRNA-degrading endonuclease RelE of RelBE toxin-antitoxin system